MTYGFALLDYIDLYVVYTALLNGIFVLLEFMADGLLAFLDFISNGDLVLLDLRLGNILSYDQAV
jgi:hypothetical protein